MLTKWAFLTKVVLLLPKYAWNHYGRPYLARKFLIGNGPIVMPPESESKGVKYLRPRIKREKVFAN